MSEPALIWCPFANEEDGAAAADILLDEGLIACANLLPGIRSLYLWQGERGAARECAALFKTNAELLERAVARLEEIHPYEAPAIVGWKGDAAGAACRAWLAALGD